jgi:hypothetical protein
MKLTACWEIVTCSLVEVDRRFRGATVSIITAMIALMMEAVRTSKTSVNFYKTTRHNTLEDSHL